MGAGLFDQLGDIPAERIFSFASERVVDADARADEKPWVGVVSVGEFDGAVRPVSDISGPHFGHLVSESQPVEVGDAPLRIRLVIGWPRAWRPTSNAPRGSRC